MIFKWNFTNIAYYYPQSDIVSWKKTQKTLYCVNLVSAKV